MHLSDTAVDALPPGDCDAGGALPLQAVREEVDQRRRGTHLTGPLCCYGGHLTATGSLCYQVAHWSGGVTALCLRHGSRDLPCGEVLMVRWACLRVHALHLPNVVSSVHPPMNSYVG